MSPVEGSLVVSPCTSALCDERAEYLVSWKSTPRDYPSVEPAPTNSAGMAIWTGRSRLLQPDPPRARRVAGQ